MNLRFYRNGLMSLVVGFGLAGAVFAADKAPAEKGKPYPLTTCVVSGEKLDSMGKPRIIQYEGREIRFCCEDCEKDFRKDPKPFLKKLDEAATKSASTQPATTPSKPEEHKQPHT